MALYLGYGIARYAMGAGHARMALLGQETADYLTLVYGRVPTSLLPLLASLTHDRTATQARI